MDSWKLILVSQQVFLRQAMSYVFSSTPEYDVVLEYDSGVQVPSDLCDDQSMVIIDVCLPKEQIVDLINRLKGTSNRVIILGGSSHQEQMLDLLLLKADGYLTMDIGCNEFLSMLTSVKSGKQVIADRLITAMVDRLSGAPAELPESKKMTSLTDRENQIIALLAAGYTNNQIANKLVISVYTVKNHVHNVLEKLGIDNRTQLVSYAYTRGLVS